MKSKYIIFKEYFCEEYDCGLSFYIREKCEQQVICPKCGRKSAWLFSELKIEIPSYEDEE